MRQHGVYTLLIFYFYEREPLRNLISVRYMVA